MNLVDTNVLVNSVNERSEHHDVSVRWLDGVLSGADTLALSWQALMGFVRVATHPSAFPAPLRVDEALDQVDAWLGAPASVVVEPTARHPMILRDLLIGAGGIGGKLVHDAHLAALAIEHRARIVSYDSDFARFPGVAWSPPG